MQPTAPPTVPPTLPPTLVPTTVPTKAPTKVPTVVPTPTAVISSTLKIIQALPVPNPNPTIFYVNLSAMTDIIVLQLYNSSNVLLRTQSSGPHNLGWTIVYLPQDFLSSVTNGTYFYRMVAKTHAGAQSAPVMGALSFYR